METPGTPLSVFHVAISHRKHDRSINYQLPYKQTVKTTAKMAVTTVKKKWPSQFWLGIVSSLRAVNGHITHKLKTIQSIDFLYSPPPFLLFFIIILLSSFFSNTSGHTSIGEYNSALAQSINANFLRSRYSDENINSKEMQRWQDLRVLYKFRLITKVARIQYANCTRRFYLGLYTK